LQPSPLLHEATLNILRNTCNLLAFSGGGDSTALLFLLQEQGVSFDIAIVNYQTREQSDAEVAYAKELSTRFNKKVYTFTCKLDDENFEHTARLARYTFFERIIEEHGYNTLLSAHHLNDKLEWFLMQMSKGAGLVEMLGMPEIEQRESYTLIRPLLHVSKPSLQAYLKERSIPFFEDETNSDEHHLRNFIRHHHATPLIEAFEAGILKSFAYLEEDAQKLVPHEPYRMKELFILPCDKDDVRNIRSIDKVLKRLGLLISKAQRDEILRSRDCVVGGKIAVCFEEDTIFIAPFVRCVMDKAFKERCRKERVPSKIRPYMYTARITPNALRLNRTL
jgi:tRNA(Ile)-lysidine synthase